MGDFSDLEDEMPNLLPDKPEAGKRGVSLNSRKSFQQMKERGFKSAQLHARLRNGKFKSSRLPPLRMTEEKP